jgi:serpin B
MSTLLPSAFVLTMAITGLARGQDDATRLAAHLNRFGADLNARIAAADGNLCSSSASVAIALLMTLPGARGETAAELAKLLLPASLPAERRLEVVRELVANYRAAASKIEFAMVNDLWPSLRTKLLADYVATTQRVFGAVLRPIDYAAPAKACQVINDHVGKATRDRIKDLVTTDDIDTATLLVLTNAIYFKATWQHPFRPEDTRDARFTLAGGGGVAVKLMQQRRELQYAEVDGVQVVRLPYVDANFAFEAALPAADQPLATATAALASGTFADRLAVTEVELLLPRFRIEGAFRLKEALQALGLTHSTSGAADFSGITAGPMFIGEVLHKTFIEVGEEGTEAAAATAVVMKRSGAAPRANKRFVADRPFAFAIRDLRTGLLLFSGQLVKPVVHDPKPAATGSTGR